MTYGDMKAFILQLINRYSVAGSEMPPSYNNQQDYINRIPMLINDGLVYVAAYAKNLPAQKLIVPGEGERYGQYLRYALPEDCLAVRPGGLLTPCDREKKTTVRYILQEPDMLLVRQPFRETAVLEYYRRPQLLGEKPAENQGVDGSVDVLMALCYYVAAHLILEDDAFRYSALYNEFETRLARLLRQEQTEIAPTRDVYDFLGGGGD